LSGFLGFEADAVVDWKSLSEVDRRQWDVNMQQTFGDSFLLKSIPLKMSFKSTEGWLKEK